MNLPPFVTNEVKPFKCPKCNQIVRTNGQTAAGVSIAQRLEMTEPNVRLTVECICCGTSLIVSLTMPINWSDVLDFVLTMASADKRATNEDLSANAWKVPKDERLWIANGDQKWMFHVLGGYRRRPGITYVLGKRVPLQPGGWDGREWHGLMRLTSDRQAEIITDDDPLFLPLLEWEEFFNLPEGTTFRLGGFQWKKLSMPSLKKVTDRGTLLLK